MPRRRRRPPLRQLALTSAYADLAGLMAEYVGKARGRGVDHPSNPGIGNARAIEDLLGQISIEADEYARETQDPLAIAQAALLRNAREAMRDLLGSTRARDLGRSTQRSRRSS